MGVVILSVCSSPSVCPSVTRVLYDQSKEATGDIFYTTWKGNPSQMWFFVQLCSSWQNLNWLKASLGPSAIAELLVTVGCVYMSMYCILMYLYFSYCIMFVLCCILCCFTHLITVIMVAPCNRAGHYIFALWFLSSFVLSFFFFSSPNLSRRTLDAYHILPHMVWP